MTAAFGDFLILAGQRITAAAQYRDDLPTAARAEVIVELDRLLTIVTRYARDGLRPGGTEQTPAVSTTQDLVTSGIALMLDHAAESIHLAVHAKSTRAAAGHPAAGHLRAAADSLIAGRDLISTHYGADTDGGTDPLWAPVLNARPVAAALERELAGYVLQLAALTARLSQPTLSDGLPPAARQAVCAATGWLTFAASAAGSEPGGRRTDASKVLLNSIPAKPGGTESRGASPLPGSQIDDLGRASPGAY